MSALETSSFARKSAITTSLDRCVLYYIIVNGILFIRSRLGMLLSELAGSSFLLNAYSVGEFHR